MNTIPVWKYGEIQAYALVDEADYEWAMRWRWQFHKGDYAWRVPRGGPIMMHRALLGLGRSDRCEVNHLNGNKLDNRRENLRIGTHQENAWGFLPARASSGYRGVSWDKSRNKWRAQCGRDGKMYMAGRFERLEDAVAAAEALRARIFQ